MEQYVKYLRKSRFDRDYADLSIEETLKRHEAILDKLANDRGYYIAKTYYEVVSGESIAARPEIQKMLEEVSAGLYAGVLVVDVERLARGNGADQAYISQVFQFSGTKIITPTIVKNLPVKKPVVFCGGAYGVSLLAYESVGIKIGNSGKPEKESLFLGFDFPSKEVKKQDMTEEICKNKELYKMAGQFSMRGYDATIDPDRKTIGIPMVLVMFKFFTLANEFFRDLGYNVVMSHVSNEETIQLSQQYAQGETCYPVKLVYGHMMQLAQQKWIISFSQISIRSTIRMHTRHAAMPARICRRLQNPSMIPCI